MEARRETGENVREGERVDDDGEAREVELHRHFERRPRVSAVGAQGIQEGVHHDGIGDKRVAHVDESVGPAWDRGLSKGGMGAMAREEQE